MDALVEEEEEEDEEEGKIAALAAAVPDAQASSPAAARPRLMSMAPISPRASSSDAVARASCTSPRSWDTEKTQARNRLALDICWISCCLVCLPAQLDSLLVWP